MKNYRDKIDKLTDEIFHERGIASISFINEINFDTTMITTLVTGEKINTKGDDNINEILTQLLK